jgi:hypothetical protein
MPLPQSLSRVQKDKVTLENVHKWFMMENSADVYTAEIDN